ncbi:uncharacterized protein [Lepeophtheirus salmonis]|uniref:Uncharacterized protein n=1 Tax=Lepeophtheirus salmonis TaxID=72036 RepID=A0A0K2U1S1_LEPSM|nr:uncharacterized protein LOC121119637 [Lepeophtheirus salmonis]
MYSNPILKALKTRSLGPAFMSDDVITVSSHESAQASLQSSNKPGEKEVGGRSSNKARWCNPSDTSSRQTTTDPSNNRKERSLKSVEEWLWDARSGESTLANEICDELILKTKMKENDNSKPLFDLSKKEFAMTATFATKSQAPSQQSSSLWEDKKCSEGGDDSKCSPFDGKLMDAAENNRREGRRDIPIHRGLGALGSTLDEVSPAFKSFIDRFKAGSTLSMVEESELMRDPMRSFPDQYSASCPMEYLYPNLDNITCDISAQSSESFWNKTYSWYQNEDEDVRRKRELEDEGCIKNYEDSVKIFRTRQAHENFEIPSSIFEQPPLFDEAFLAPGTRDNSTLIEKTQEIEEEDVLIINNPDEEETDSNDDKSSGYVGSEERSRSASGSRASSSIKDETQQITYISTKLYRQALGRKRRYTSTPHCSPNTSYESLLSTLMPPPPPPGPNISIIEEPIY